MIASSWRLTTRRYETSLQRIMDYFYYNVKPLNMSDIIHGDLTLIKFNLSHIYFTTF